MDADTPSHDMLPTTQSASDLAEVTDAVTVVPHAEPDDRIPEPDDRIPAWALRHAPDLRAAGLAVVLSAVLGPLAGLLWNALAPRVLVGNNSGTVYWLAPESKTFVAQDGWFAGVTVLAGLITVTVVALMVRRGAIGAAIGLAVGGVVGSLAALATGVLVGPGDVVDQADFTSGSFAAPLELRSVGFIFAWPLIAIIVHLTVTIMRHDGETVPAALAAPHEETAGAG
jgi:hypothetical protein